MGFINWIKNVVGIEDAVETVAASKTAAPAIATAAPVVSLPMAPEEKELVAVIAACIVGKDQPDASLHIKRITRIE